MRTPKFQPYELAILTAFRKARADGRYTLPCDSQSDAMSLRAKCYSLAKKVRTAAESVPELAASAENCDMVSLRVEPDNSLTFLRKDMDSGIQSLMRALGNEQDVMVDQAAAESQKKMMDAILKEPELSKNPYFKRTGTGASE